MAPKGPLLLGLMVLVRLAGQHLRVLEGEGDLAGGTAGFEELVGSGRLGGRRRGSPGRSRPRRR